MPDTEQVVIESVKLLNKREEVAESTDPFDFPAEDLKKYEGIRPGAKRSITNTLKKSYTGKGNTGSKRIDEKEIVGYDIFKAARPPINLYSFAKLYEMSAGHYAAVNAKTANIVGLGFNFVESRKTKRTLERVDDEKKLNKLRRKLDEHRDGLFDLVEELNDEDTFIEMLSKVWKDYETTGNGYIEVGRSMDGSIGYVGHIPSPTLRVRILRDGFVQIVNGKVQFFRNYGDQKTQNPYGSNDVNEIIHLKKYSPTNTFYGMPDIIAAQQAVAGNEYSSQYNLDFFENKAVPRYVITLKGASLGPKAESDLLKFFETGLKGQNHRSIFIPLPPDTADNKVEFTMKPIETGVQEASFSTYRKENLADILMAHRVPITKVSSGAAASVAVAQDADKTFKEQVCAPEQRILEKKLNKIIKEFTDAFELKLDEMTLTDEKTRAQIFDLLLKTGVYTRNEVRAVLGMPGIDGGDEIIDMNKNNTQMAEQRANRERDTTRQTNATDSQGQGRNPKGSGRTDGTQ